MSGQTGAAMRHGLEVSCGGTGVQLSTLIEVGVLAEQAGWDAVFFEDYLVHYDGEDPPTFDPWVMLAAIACRTDRIRLGTTVTALPRRHPGKLAREVITLDHLSGGRVTLAVGAGDPADRGTGRLRARSGELLDEGLDVLLGLLSGERVQAAGPHYPVDGVTYRPGPQQPRLPVWVGGSTQASAVIRRAARVGGVVPYKVTDTREWSDLSGDEVARLIDEIRALRTSTEPLDVAIGGRRRRPDERAERRYLDEIEQAGATWWLEFVPGGTLEQMRAAVLRGPLRA